MKQVYRIGSRAGIGDCVSSCGESVRHVSNEGGVRIVERKLVNYQRARRRAARCSREPPQVVLSSPESDSSYQNYQDQEGDEDIELVPRSLP